MFVFKSWQKCPLSTAKASLCFNTIQFYTGIFRNGNQRMTHRRMRAHGLMKYTERLSEFTLTLPFEESNKPFDWSYLCVWLLSFIKGLQKKEGNILTQNAECWARHLSKARFVCFTRILKWSALGFRQKLKQNGHSFKNTICYCRQWHEIWICDIKIMASF